MTIIERDSKQFIKAKIVLMGDGAVGKTTLKRRYLGRGFRENYLATLGTEIRIKKVNLHGRFFEFHIWDMAGQLKYSALRTRYYMGSTGAILVYDITKRASLISLKTWLKEFYGCITTREIPLIVVGNKIDLRPTARLSVSTEQGQKFVEELKETWEGEKFIHFIEASAKSNININELFEKLGEEILKIVELY